MAFERPRVDIAALLGDAQQGCPVLVPAATNIARHAVVRTSDATGTRFVAGVADITVYLAYAYGISSAHP